MALSMAACVPREAAPAIESVGEIVEFGNWRGEPIAWRVLDIEDDRALLISEDVLELRQYDGLERYYGERLSDADIDWNSVSITWADSEIRAWLNDDFLSEAFSAGERRAIRLSEISNPDNPKYGTLGGRDTEDRVFLLSIDEAERYFASSSDRIARYEGEAWWWWLRSPGIGSSYAAIVSYNGDVYDDGYIVYSNYGVRPALYINLESENL